jgi:histidinol-phosphatase (PHP family)
MRRIHVCGTAMHRMRSIPCFAILFLLGKCIEINTASYRNLGDLEGTGRGLAARRYAELGGEHVTFGSDAHEPKHIGYRFNDAVETALRAGIKYYATYDEMVPAFHKL